MLSSLVSTLNTASLNADSLQGTSQGGKVLTEDVLRDLVYHAMQHERKQQLQQFERYYHPHVTFSHTLAQLGRREDVYKFYRLLQMFFDVHPKIREVTISEADAEAVLYVDQVVALRALPLTRLFPAVLPTMHVMRFGKDDTGNVVVTEHWDNTPLLPLLMWPWAGLAWSLYRQAVRPSAGPALVGLGGVLDKAEGLGGLLGHNLDAAWWAAQAVWGRMMDVLGSGGQEGQSAQEEVGSVSSDEKQEEEAAGEVGARGVAGMKGGVAERPAGAESEVAVGAEAKAKAE